MSEAPILSDDHIKAIGEMVVAMTRVESLVIDLLGIFMGSKSVVHTVAAFSHQQMSNNVDTLSAIASIGFTKEELKGDRFAGVMSQCKALADFRNTVVHAYWTIDDAGRPLAVRYQARGYFKRTRTPISAEEIRAKAHEAGELEKTLRGLRDHLHAEDGPAK